MDQPLQRTTYLSILHLINQTCRGTISRLGLEKPWQAAYSDQQGVFFSFVSQGGDREKAVCASNGQVAWDPLFWGTGLQPSESFHFSVKVF